MDDPLRWGKVRRSINRAIEKHKLDTEQGIRGSSLVTMIFQELRADGHIITEDEEEGEDHRNQVRSRAAS